MTIQEKFGFRKVLNTRGPATILGAARVGEEIRQDISDMLGQSAEIWELQRRASRVDCPPDRRGGGLRGSLYLGGHGGRDRRGADRPGRSENQSPA